MASNPQTLNTYDKFLKEYYLSSWIDQLNSMSTTWALLRRKIVDFAGRRMVFPVRKSRNTGVGAIPVSGTPSVNNGLSTLIEAGQQGIENGIVSPKIVMGALEIAQDVIDSSKNDRGAFFSAIDFEMAGLVQDIAEDLDRQTYGNGNGQLARVTAAAVTGQALVQVSYHRPFYEGMKLDFWSSGASGATSTDHVGLVVLSVQRNNDGSGVLTLTTNIINSNITDNSSVTRTGVRTSTVGYEFMGLGGLIDSSNPPLEATFQGVTRSGNAWWQSIEDTSALLNETFIQTNLDNVHDDSNGDIDCLLMNRKTRRNLYDALATDNPRRMVNSNLLMPGYISGKLEDHHPDAHDFLFFDGRIPIVVDKFCPIDIDTQGTPSSTGTVFGCDLSSLYAALVTDFKWWDGGQGTVLRPSTSRKFGLEAVLYIMGNLVTDAPRKNFKNESLVLS